MEATYEVRQRMMCVAQHALSQRIAHPRGVLLVKNCQTATFKAQCLPLYRDANAHENKRFVGATVFRECVVHGEFGGLDINTLWLRVRRARNAACNPGRWIIARRTALAVCFGFIGAGCQNIAPAERDALQERTLLQDALQQETAHILAEPTAVTPFPPLALPPPPMLAAEVNVLPPSNVWHELVQALELDPRLDERRVRLEIRWLQRNPEFLTRLADRAATFQAYVLQEVLRRDMPAEVALIPLVESALNPHARSVEGAVGLWQFMPATGRRFGLGRDWWHDERRDPISSTRAALDYLAFLHRKFDDWLLAFAAYNAGEGTVQKAVRRAERDGRSTDFFSLSLPRETRMYVPRVLAFAAVLTQPEKYRVSVPAVANHIPFIAVRTHSQFDVGVAADALNADPDMLKRWNPSLNQWSTPPHGPHHLIVPKTLARNAQTALDAVPPDARIRSLQVQIRSGDTLSALAIRHRSSVAAIKAANRLTSSRIFANQILTIPRDSKPQNVPPEVVVASAPARSYRVQNGDSLWTIARRFGTSVSTLAFDNGLTRSSVLQIGQVIALPGGDDSTASYRVRHGDSLWRIAGRFNLSVEQLARWNEIDVGHYLQPGQQLVLHAGGGG